MNFHNTAATVSREEVSLVSEIAMARTMKLSNSTLTIQFFQKKIETEINFRLGSEGFISFVFDDMAYKMLQYLLILSKICIFIYDHWS